jgi:ribosomal protein S27E
MTDAQVAAQVCVASVVPGTSSTAICSGLPVHRGWRIFLAVGSKSRETIYGGSVRAAAERATEARKAADRLAVEAWNKRMLGFQGPAQPSPTLGDAINAGFGYLEVKCLGCDTHQTVALDIVRRPKTTPVHELERYMRCRQCSEVRATPTSGAIWWRCARPRSR